MGKSRKPLSRKTGTCGRERVIASRMVSVWKMEPMSTVASTLRCIVAQRLVRRLCPHCSLVDDSVSHEDEKELRRIGKRLGLAHAHPRKASPEGCFYCQNSGYYGRIGVYEILEINGELEDRISAGTPNGELRKCALEQGWTPLAGDACEKVLLGLTDLAELHRIC